MLPVCLCRVRRQDIAGALELSNGSKAGHRETRRWE
jgi:hypothetical protein